MAAAIPEPAEGTISPAYAVSDPEPERFIRTAPQPAAPAPAVPSGVTARLQANIAALTALDAVTREHRPATRKEQVTLSAWSGWGACSEVFDTARAELEWAREQISLLLTPDEIRAARRSTLNAHYTDPGIVAAVWDAVARLGFTGGAVLEPGCGSGNFIAAAPKAARMTGVELDPVTARICTVLHPGADIRAESFTDTRVPEGYFDLVIGNVPFGDYAPVDDVHNRDGHQIHNYFVLKSLRLLRPGGILAVVTSRYTLDSERGIAARQQMAGLADIIGAVRLPSGAHQRTAGTKAVTDVLLLRRRPEDAAPVGKWPGRWAALVDGVSMYLSDYWRQHPGRVLGTMHPGGMYRADDLTVTPLPGDIPAQLAAALAGITADAATAGLVWEPRPAGAPVLPPVLPAACGEEGFLSGTLAAGFTIITGGQPVTHIPPKTQAAELAALLRVRDTARALITAEADTAEDTPAIAGLRAQLNADYDACTGRFGPINRFRTVPTGKTDPDTGLPGERQLRPGQGGFRSDPYAPLVYALEDFDDAEQTAVKARIFRERVTGPPVPRVSATTPDEALAVCLDTCGEIRIPEIARLLGCSLDEARERLDGLVYPDPRGGDLIPAEEYLSGLVRQKLREAEQAAARNPAYAVNVTALRAVIPADLGPADIRPRLGAAWIGCAYVQQFVRELLADSTIMIEHPGGSMWTVRGGNRRSVLATSTWGSRRLPAVRLVEMLLEQRPVEVRDENPDTGATWINLEETMAAQAKADEMAEAFTDWVWAEPGRARDLADTYNYMFNGIVLRDYEEAGRRVTFPGLAPWFIPHPHQRTAVARVIAEPTALLGHAVGAGKTFEMAASVMKLRDLHLIRTAMVVVPNNMLMQFSREWLAAFPQARILVAEKDDLHGERRRRLMARCVTGTWDAVVISQSAFTRIPVDAATRQAYMDREVQQLRAWLNKSREGDALSVKRIERKIANTEALIERKLSGKRDPGLTFAQLCIDYLVVDEAHYMKNLKTASAIRDAVIAGSIRAEDLAMKLGWMREQGRRRLACFATGTPIANSITEAHVMLRYLRPDLLIAAGVLTFDAWAATFGKVISKIELAPEGGGQFRINSRFAEFVNVPELMLMWRVFTDVKLAEDLNLPIPLLTAGPDGRRDTRTIAVPASPEQQDYILKLGGRAGEVRAGQVDPKDDNMLRISTHGRLAALHLQLVPDADDYGPEPTPADAADLVAEVEDELQRLSMGKVPEAARNILAEYRKHAGDVYPLPDGRPSPVRGSLQIVFCDLGTPGDKWNVYDYLRDMLTAGGIPATRIRYIHEAKTDRAKAALYAACRSGRVSVILGSTEKMGVGVNIQTRACALHHLDPPWRPADIEQRDGRALRQGNLNPEVAVYRYVVEGSFDGYMWQTLARKARFIAQLMRGNLSVREMADIGDRAMSYAEVMALATGNPLLLEHAEAMAELTRLERAERGHQREQDGLEFTIKDAGAAISAAQERIAAIDVAIGRRHATTGDDFTMIVDGSTVTKRATAGDYLKSFLLSELGAFQRKMAYGVPADQRFEAGWLGGFKIAGAVFFRQFDQTLRIDLVLRDLPGGATTMTARELRGADPVGTVRQLENMLGRLETLRGDEGMGIARQQAQIRHAQESAGRPFRGAGELTAARARVAEINEAMTVLAKENAKDPSKPAPAPAVAA